jgi:hypothetical protein
MVNGNWTLSMDGTSESLQLRSSSGKLLLTASDARVPKCYDLTSYVPHKGGFWEGLYRKRDLNSWLTEKGYPRL